jgi:hypothetical protein
VFTLLDQKGQSRTLASLMEPKGLMLVFYRSPDCCPYCKTNLAERQTRTADLAKSVTGYKPIAFSVQPQAGLLTRGAQYPPSEDYHFKPLNEHGQVYQRPFRIVQDVLIDPSPQVQTSLKDMTSITIKGVLNYQACDDKVCFTPQTVPLTWTVTLRQLDCERAKP